MSKLDGIKAGDRVRLVMEGVMGVKAEHDDKKLRVTLDGSPHSWGLWDSEINAPTFQIIRIEPAFKVGDRVIYMSSSDESVIVAFLKDGRAVIEYPAGDTSSVVARDISCLKHA